MALTLPRLARASLGLALVGTLALLLFPASSAEAGSTCQDPQFRIGPAAPVFVPQGTRWDSYGGLHQYGTVERYGVWADNWSGVAAACLRFEGSDPYDICIMSCFPETS